jgi:hypothetical protein
MLSIFCYHPEQAQVINSIGDASGSTSLKAVSGVLISAVTFMRIWRKENARGVHSTSNYREDCKEYLCDASTIVHISTEKNVGV